MKAILLILIVICFFSIPVFSQTSSLTSGIITASNPTLTPCPPGKIRNFKYLGIKTEINGVADPGFSGAATSECSYYCCMYGKGFVIQDTFLGNNNFRYTTGPVIINGVNYSTVYFKGSLLVNGVIRVPFYFRKKQTATLTGKAILSGHLNSYLTPLDVINNNPFFSKSISDPEAKVTITIQPRQGDSSRFDIVDLKYEFVNAN